MAHHHHRPNGHGSADKLAATLSWFSIGLGAVQLLAPRRVGSALGMEGHEGTLQACGLREIATGIGILSSRERAPWLWGRVAGDVLDLAALTTGLGHSNPRRGAVGAVLGAVAAVTVLDVAGGFMATGQRQRPRAPLRDYSDRSGFPDSPENMRGIARRTGDGAAGRGGPTGIGAESE